MDYYQIGQQIRKIRRAKGLSQEELAEKINISTTHMSHIETGSTKLSLPVLVDIAKELQVRTDAIIYAYGDADDEAQAEVAHMMRGCTEREARIIADVVKAVKQAMEQYI